MNETLEKSALINRKLTTKMSEPDQRGHEIVQEKQKVRALIGDFENNYRELFTEFIKIKYDPIIRVSPYCDDILEYAENGSIDIFILVINNLCFSGVESSSSSIDDQLEKSLQLITQIKTICARPVIALSTFDESSPLITRSKLIADFYFQMPFKPEPFLEAIEECIGKAPYA